MACASIMGWTYLQLDGMLPAVCSASDHAASTLEVEGQHVFDGGHSYIKRLGQGFSSRLCIVRFRATSLIPPMSA